MFIYFLYWPTKTIVRVICLFVFIFSTTGFNLTHDCQTPACGNMIMQVGTERGFGCLAVIFVDRTMHSGSLSAAVMLWSVNEGVNKTPQFCTDLTPTIVLNRYYYGATVCPKPR